MRYSRLIGMVWAILALAGSVEARTMKVRVVDDETGKAVPRAVVKIGPEANAITAVTNGDGLAALSMPRGEDPASPLTAQADGYMLAQAYWLESRISALPESYTMRLRHGVQIGGIVTNDKGEPLAGVRVTAHAQVLVGRPGGGWPSISFFSPRDPVLTDAKGHWKLQSPVHPREYFLRMRHTDYYVDAIDISSADAAAAGKLREGSFPTTMSRGAQLRGHILGADGKPLARGHVWIEGEEDRSPVDAPGSADGSFSIDSARPGKVVVLVGAAGHALTRRQIDLAAGETRMDFTLQPAKPLQGTVVTKSGEPVANAWVCEAEHISDREFLWQTHTDANGRFVWDEAPDEQVTLAVQAPGMFPQWSVKVRPGEADLKIRMQATLCIRGKVLDAENGRVVGTPIHVLPGAAAGKSGKPMFRGEDTATFDSGQFNVWILQEHVPTWLRVGADGYLPEIIGPFESGHDFPTIEVQLTKGASSSFTVQTPQGEPAGGAEVALVFPGKTLWLFDGRPEGGFEQCIRTDAHGNFVLQPHRTPGWLWISQPDGYAWLPEMAQGGNIRLTPWGWLKGEVRAGKEIVREAHPVFSCEPSSRQPGEPDLEARYQSVWADDAGHFELSRVMEGTLHAYRQTSAQQGNRKGTQTIHYAQSIHINAGHTTEVVLGGTGSDIKGTITVPPGLKNWRATDSALSREGPALPVPADFNQKTEREQNAWLIHYWKSLPVTQEKPGATDVDDSSDTPVKILPDGTLHAGDLTPGTYGLSITLRVPRAADDPWKARPGFNEDSGKPVAQLIRHVVVTAQSEPMIDLGQLTLGPPRGVEVGDMAPDFSAPAVDGKVITLADLRGKWVLLDHWATWCGPCVAELPEIQKVYDEYAKGGRLVVLGMAWDDPEKVRTFAKEKGYAWTQCVADVGAKAQLEVYVRGIPQTYLIDPAGKIVARSPPPEQMLDTVKGFVDRR